MSVRSVRRAQISWRNDALFVVHVEAVEVKMDSGRLRPSDIGTMVAVCGALRSVASKGFATQMGVWQVQSGAACGSKKGNVAFLDSVCQVWDHYQPGPSR